jgi:hypothetical protein
VTPSTGYGGTGMSGFGMNPTQGQLGSTNPFFH